MGELLRRYWHPIGLAARRHRHAAQGPRAGRGPDPVPRRAAAGPAWCYPHCAHRGTSLYYGKVEERGIRCCYHGWLFDVARPLPRAALRARRRSRPRQGAPALVSGAGAVRPGLRLHGPARARSRCCRATTCLDVLDEGEFLECRRQQHRRAAVRRSCPATGCSTTRTSSTRIHVVDPARARFSGTQFVGADGA